MKVIDKSMEMIVIVSTKSIEQTINDFINYCIFEKGLSDKTKESYYNDLNIYKEYLNNNKKYNVDDIKASDIKDFIKERNSEETTTIAHNLTVIKNYHAYLLKEKIVRENVSEFIERPKLKKSLPKSHIRNHLSWSHKKVWNSKLHIFYATQGSLLRKLPRQKLILEFLSFGGSHGLVLCYLSHNYPETGKWQSQSIQK